MNITTDIRRIIDYFKGRNEVSALYIFGSAAQGNEKSESDLDIAVLIDNRKKGRRTYDSLRKTYYTVSPKFSMLPVDIVILNAAVPFLKYRIIKSGKLLFDRNRKLRVRFAADAIIEYLDFKPIEDFFARAVADRFRRGAVGR